MSPCHVADFPVKRITMLVVGVWPVVALSVCDLQVLPCRMLN
jgi:hypothetical protein